MSVRSRVAARCRPVSSWMKRKRPGQTCRLTGSFRSVSTDRSSYFLSSSSGGAGAGFFSSGLGASSFSSYGGGGGASSTGGAFFASASAWLPLHLGAGRQHDFREPNRFSFGRSSFGSSSFGSRRIEHFLSVRHRRGAHFETGAGLQQPTFTTLITFRAGAVAQSAGLGLAQSPASADVSHVTAESATRVEATERRML